MDLAKGAFALDAVDLRVAGDAPAAPGLVATIKCNFEVDPEGTLVDIAKLSIGGAVGVTEAAVPLVKDLMHGLRRKQ